ncbi:kinesin-domain-containing protein [Gymnopus androsaceus JB14]|uniref:Kinesin-domain-containing protein n=1 Tax=Gymnopus androsaceus JB14 TaxID=1447944 RepID=A0A6A4HY38_9AGAR|nr:kinesin-domain-containing protein [Gymnopus androsaceus JB14]
MSELSLIDRVVGSEKAAGVSNMTDGKHINRRPSHLYPFPVCFVDAVESFLLGLLALSNFITKLCDNSTKKKSDHVPSRDSKLTRLLQSSLSGNARISVICTINHDLSAASETTPTLQFAGRVKSVKFHAVKKQVGVDRDALIEK